jgi:hypothetical protein
MLRLVLIKLIDPMRGWTMLSKQLVIKVSGALGECILTEPIQAFRACVLNSPDFSETEPRIVVTMRPRPNGGSEVVFFLRQGNRIFRT